MMMKLQGWCNLVDQILGVENLAEDRDWRGWDGGKLERHQTKMDGGFGGDEKKEQGKSEDGRRNQQIEHADSGRVEPCCHPLNHILHPH